MQVLIAACILRMVSSVPTLAMREQRPSKYKAQMFDCGVPGKIQVLISEKCSKVKSKPVKFKLGKIEPTLARKPELIGSGWYRKRYY